jgi:4-hydroxybenzoate polyprenyltransferase
MKLIAAFFQLIRWPNLFFIALTQSLFYYAVVKNVYGTSSQVSGLGTMDFLFALLVLASVCIAAAGYIINDYFDRQIDAINKPDRIVIDRHVKRRWAIVWHLSLSALGILISAWVSYRTDKWVILFANTFSVMLLWVYSTRFKKKLLTGNLLIAALTAWVIVVLYFFSGASLINYKGWNPGHHSLNNAQLYKFTFLYAGFAFIISLIREVIKDIEDMQGDAQYASRTMPIVWGIPVTKMFTAVWMVVCIAALFIILLYAWQSGWWAIAVYSTCVVLLPLVYLLWQLHRASLPADYHRLSNLLKWIMLAGILSMLFFFLPNR